MGVGGVDNNNSVEQRNRADNSRKEADTEKRHAEEINRLRQMQYEKIKELEEVHQKAMDEQREATREVITDRDKKYQKEMDDLRKMNRERVIALTTSYDDKLQKTRENSSGMLAAEKRVSEQQKNNLTETFTSELKQKDADFSEAFSNAKKLQQEGMKKDHEDLNLKHKQDLDLLVKNRDETVGDLSDEMRELRRAKNEVEKEARIKQFKQRNNMQDQFGYELMRERKTSNEVAGLQKQAFDESLRKTQVRYKDAMVEEKARTSESLKKANGDINDRQNGQFAVLERRLKESNDKANESIIEYRRLSDLERQHMMEDVSKNLAVGEQTSRAATENSNNKNRVEIQKMANRNAEAMHMLDMSSKDRTNVMKAQYEDEIEQKTGMLKNEKDKLKLSSELKYKQRNDMFENDRKALEQFYYNNLAEMKKSYDEALLEQRVTTTKERNQAIERLQTQMRGNDNRAQEKLVTVTTSFEKQISDLKINNKKDIDSLRREYESRIKNDSKASQQNMENLKLKYETQLATQKDSYEERIRQIQKAHEDEKINMAKSTS